MERIDTAVLRYLINALWQPILIVAAGILADSTLQRVGARFRCWLWIVVLLLCVLAPGIEGQFPTAPVNGGSFRLSVDAHGVFVAQGARTAAAWITLAYALFVAFLWARLLISLRKLTTWRKHSEPLGDGIFLSNLVTAPLTFGTIEPVILLPSYFAAEGTKKTIAAVVAHEQAHVERKDFAWNALLLAITAPVRFHPAVWFAHQRMAMVRELACDELASSRIPGYLDQLLEAAAVLTQRPSAGGMIEAVGLGLFDCNSFEERVMKLMNHKPLLPTWAARSITAALSLTLALGTVYITTNHSAFAQRAEKVGKDVKAPQLIYKVEPSYDPSAKEDKVEGSVVLSLVVTTAGIAEDIQVVKSLDPRLDQKAIEAVKQWRFQPGTKDDKDVNVEAKIEVNFRLL